MKILQINACYERGSTGRMMKEMHQYFLAKGYESYACSPNYKGNDKRIINIGWKIDYLVHSLFSRLFGLQGYFSVMSTLKLLCQISKIKPDIVHLHNLHNNYINLPILLSYIRRNNIATVITMHDFWFMTGHCCYYTNDNCQKWKYNCGKCPAIKTYNRSWFFDNSSWLRTKKEKYLLGIKRLAIIGNSKWTTNESRQSFLGRSFILDHIYNWIDTNVFYPRNKTACRKKYHYRENDTIILGIAQGWNSLKGLNVFKELAQRNPVYRFILVGEILDISTLPQNIETVGTIRNTDKLAEYYSLSDIYLNPSVQETFGLVTAEAISCGLPVIANNATATPELVLPGCGYIIDNNNIEQIEACICKISAEHYDPDMLHSVAVNNFSIRNIEKYLTIYQKLLTNE